MSECQCLQCIVCTYLCTHYLLQNWACSHYILNTCMYAVKNGYLYTLGFPELLDSWLLHSIAVLSTNGRRRLPVPAQVEPYIHRSSTPFLLSAPTPRRHCSSPACLPINPINLPNTIPSLDFTLTTHIFSACRPLVGRQPTRHRGPSGDFSGQALDPPVRPWTRG